MKKIQQGFTLIELMIVVAIIGILAAVAIPAYQDYITRAQVSEAAELLSGFKTPLAEFYGDKGHWPANIGAKNCAACSLEGTINGKYTNISTTVGGAGTSGTVTLTATMTVGQAKSTTVTLTSANGGALWDCTGGSALVKYRPAGCKP